MCQCRMLSVLCEGDHRPPGGLVGTAQAYRGLMKASTPTVARPLGTGADKQLLSTSLDQVHTAIDMHFRHLPC